MAEQITFHLITFVNSSDPISYIMLFNLLQIKEALPFLTANKLMHAAIRISWSLIILILFNYDYHLVIENETEIIQIVKYMS